MAVTTVNIIARVYIFIDTRRICRTLFFDIVGFVAKGLNRKLTSRCGYKYILNRWARVVFDRGIGPTPFSWRIHARMDIGVHGLYIQYAYGVPPPTTIYYIVLPPNIYLITISTGIDKVRTEIPLPYNLVLGLYVVSMFTVAITTAQPTYTTTHVSTATLFAIPIASPVDLPANGTTIGQ